MILEFTIDAVPFDCGGGADDDVFIIVAVNFVANFFVLFLTGQFKN